MDAMASQITRLIIVYLTVYSDADQRKHQSSASLAFVRGFHRRPVNSPHKWPVTRKMFPSDDVIMTAFEPNVYAISDQYFITHKPCLVFQNYIELTILSKLLTTVNLKIITNIWLTKFRIYIKIKQHEKSLCVATKINEIYFESQKHA